MGDGRNKIDILFLGDFIQVVTGDAAELIFQLGNRPRREIGETTLRNGACRGGSAESIDLRCSGTSGPSAASLLCTIFES